MLLLFLTALLKAVYVGSLLSQLLPGFDRLTPDEANRRCPALASHESLTGLRSTPCCTA